MEREVLAGRPPSSPSTAGKSVKGSARWPYILAHMPAFHLRVVIFIFFQNVIVKVSPIIARRF